ncbi:MAG: HAD hydrolase-like protein, partial [Candidatus Brocadiae bacterium]|nr:HAD hydrolase-like protein [Candidatus Brocadiia bacterium]
SKIMLQEALDLIDLEAGECAMLGDRPETDIQMAHCTPEAMGWRASGRHCRA